ncbi:hypothetical protein Hanom_Chr03g00208881 [Helianthus anomalus]
MGSSEFGRLAKQVVFCVSSRCFAGFIPKIHIFCFSNVSKRFWHLTNIIV